MIVLGGGVAGLAAGMASGAPIYEAAPKVGGVAATDCIDGFAFDRGIHILQTQHETVHDVLKTCGVQLGTRDRNAHIYSHGVYTAYPFQVNTAGMPLGLRARCVWNFLHRTAEKPATPPPANYEQWIVQNLGQGFGDTFLIPYSEKFWTVHPREMTSEWTGNRVPKPNTWQVLRGAVISKQTQIGSNAVFQYPENEPGYGAIPNAMGRQADVRLNHRAVRIDIARHMVHFQNGVEVPYDQIISTIPLPALIPLIPEAPEEVCQAAGRLRCNSILVVNLGIAKEGVGGEKHWVHFPGKDVCFFRLSFPHNLGPGMVPPGHSSIACEVAYSDWMPVDRQTIVDRTVADLVKVGLLDPSAPIVCRNTYDVKYGYVIYDHHRKAALKTIHDWLRSVNIHPAGRYGLWAYLWSHEALLSGRQTAERLLKRSTVGEESDAVV